LRVHGRLRGRLDLLSFFASVYLSYRVLGRVLREVRRILVEVYGLSRSAVRRLIRFLSGVVSEFLRSAAPDPSSWFGIHGLSKLSRGITGAVEIGVDLVAPLPLLPKFHLKVYSTTAEEASRRSLLDYSKALILRAV